MGICIALVGAYVGVRVTGISDPLVKWIPAAAIGITNTNLITVTITNSVTNIVTISAKTQDDPVVARFQSNYSDLRLRGAQLLTPPQNPYIVESVSLLIKIEERNDVQNGQTNRIREADERIVYIVRGLKSFQRAPKVFRETYGSLMGTVFYVPGSEEEITREAHFKMEGQVRGQINWDVLFDLEAGDSRTVVTGAKFLYAEPFGGGELHGVILRANETAFCYDNEEDLIQECLILVESETINLKPAFDALQRTKGNVLPKQTRVAERGFLGSSRAVVTARWTNCVPQEKPTLVFRW